MAARHTPGPWYRGEDGFIYGRNGERVASAHVSTALDPSEMNANDDLIAKAPDLLETLENVVAYSLDRWIKPPGIGQPLPSWLVHEMTGLRDSLRAEIRKATGEESR